MNLELNLSENEKEEVLGFLTYLASNKIEDFVKKFYKYFLNPQTLPFLQKTSNETLINMFTSFTNTILTHLQHPMHLEEHLEYMLEQQPQLQGLLEYSNEFIDAFIKSLDDFLEDKRTDEIILLWTTVVTKYVMFIKSHS